MIKLRSIRSKVTAIVVAVMAALAVLHLISLVLFEHATLTSSLKLKANLAATTQAHALSQPVAESNIEVATKILASLRSDPDFMAAQVKDDHGAVIVNIKNDFPIASGPSMHVEATAPIIFKSDEATRYVGSVSVTFSAASISEQINGQLLVGGSILLGLTLFALFGILRGIYRVTRPIEELSSAVGKILRGEALAVIPVSNSEDEIAELGRAVSLMVHELNILNKGLEQKVQQRTAELHQAVETAEHANKMKSMFLATMSHELRTPLNGIIGMGEILLGSPLRMDQQLYVRMAREAAEGMASIINDVLDLSKIEAGCLSLNRQESDIEQIIAQVFRSIGIRASMKGLEMACEIHPCPLPMVHVDPLRVRQILINLIGNAIKFTDMGSIVVSAQLDDDGPEGTNLVLSVRDTGIGIPVEKQETLFNPFTQADSQISAKYGGTGLGLSICQQLAELMSGSLTVESSPKRGSTFRCRIPIKTGAEVVPPNLEVLEKHPVLLIHGEGRDTRSVLHALVSYGLQIHVLRSVEAALRNSAQRSHSSARWFCAVISSELAKEASMAEMRELSRILEGRIVMTLASDRLTEMDGFLQIGVREVVSRPFVPSEILSAIDRLQVPSRGTGQNPSVKVCESAPNEKGGKKRILVSDDTEVNRLVAKLLLEQDGHQVETVRTGQETIDAIKGGKNFDLLVLDLNLPDITGTEVATSIRKDGTALAQIPIVAVTAHASNDKREECFAVGINECLHKPINRAELTRVVKQLLDLDIDTAWHLAKPKQQPLAEEVISVSDLLSRYDGDWGLIEAIAEAFAKERAQLQTALHTALSNADRDSLLKAAHAIKSSAGNISAGHLWRHADKVERGANYRDFETLSRWVTNLVTSWSEAIVEIGQVVRDRRDRMSEEQV